MSNIVIVTVLPPPALFTLCLCDPNKSGASFYYVLWKEKMTVPALFLLLPCVCVCARACVCTSDQSQRVIHDHKPGPDLAFPTWGEGENVMGAPSSPMPLRVTG